MNILTPAKKLSVISALVEGNSVRSTERMTGVHRDTICRLLVDVGNHCETLLDSHLKNLKCEFAV
jgi:transposase-like protein